MLTELHVAGLGIVADLTLVLGPGLTAITGETGAGKTLLVEAVELLVGGRADTTLVRDGASEARVEGRFVDAGTGDEVVLARVVPLDGRSRAYVDGRLATVGELAEVGGRLVDLHGQHAHQSLLAPVVQRAALDRFAGPPATDPLAVHRAARAEMRRIDAELAGLGGDDRARARDTVEDDPQRLEEVRARRKLLRELTRKYGETLADVRAYAGDARRRLAELESYEARAAELEQAREATRAQAVDAATVLSRARQAGAGSLAEAVTPHLRELAMPAAAFEVVVEAGEPTDDGADRVTFLISANPGEPPRPLGKVASGGEP